MRLSPIGTEAPAAKFRGRMPSKLVMALSPRLGAVDRSADRLLTPLKATKAKTRTISSLLEKEADIIKVQGPAFMLDARFN